MSEAVLLPLFPLEVVLLPGAKLPLHIFEPRYRRMVGDALRDRSEFGIVLAQSGKVEAVGCTAMVESVTKEYDDGRFDVETIGVRRFRAVEFDQSEEFLQAQVEYFDDLQDAPPSEGDRGALVEAAKQAAELLGLRVESILALRETPNPSFAAGAVLPLDLDLKQKLLTVRSERERVLHLRKYLQAWLQQRRAQQQARRLVVRNGKPR